MNKKIYTVPEIDVLPISQDDVITTSTGYDEQTELLLELD